MAGFGYRSTLSRVYGAGLFILFPGLSLVAVVNETLEISETVPTESGVALVAVINETLELAEDVATQTGAARQVDETLELTEAISTVVTNVAGGGQTSAKPAFPVLDLSHPLAKGLVLDYSFSEWDRSKDTVQDLTPNRLHGTLTGTPTWEFDSVQGTYLRFNEGIGVTDYLEFNHANRITDPGGMLWENPGGGRWSFWAKMRVATGQVGTTLFSFGKTSNAAGEIVLQTRGPDDLTFIIRIDDGSNPVAGTLGTAVNASDGNWHSILMTHDGAGAYRVYVDREVTGSSTGTTPTSALTGMTRGGIAATFRGGTINPTGEVDVAGYKIWRGVELTQQDARYLHDFPSGMYEPEGGRSFVFPASNAVAGVVNETLEISETISTELAPTPVTVINEELRIIELVVTSIASTFQQSIGETLQLSETISTALTPPSGVVIEKSTDQSRMADAHFCFHALNSTVLNGRLGDARVMWNYGDPSSGLVNLSEGHVGGHIYHAAGSYLVSCQIIDASGVTQFSTTTVVVIDTPVPAGPNDGTLASTWDLDLYVSAAGSDSNTGLSSAAPKLTFAAAFAALDAGWVTGGVHRINYRAGDVFNTSTGWGVGTNDIGTTGYLFTRAYGSGARPRINKTGSSQLFGSIPPARVHFRWKGVDANGGYDIETLSGTAAGRAFRLFSNDNDPADAVCDWVIEDAEFYGFHIAFQIGRPSSAEAYLDRSGAELEIRWLSEWGFKNVHVHSNVEYGMLGEKKWLTQVGCTWEKSNEQHVYRLQWFKYASFQGCSFLDPWWGSGFATQGGSSLALRSTETATGSANSEAIFSRGSTLRGCTTRGGGWSVNVGKTTTRTISTAFEVWFENHRFLPSVESSPNANPNWPLTPVTAIHVSVTASDVWFKSCEFVGQSLHSRFGSQMNTIPIMVTANGPVPQRDNVNAINCTAIHPAPSSGNGNAHPFLELQVDGNQAVSGAPNSPWTMPAGTDITNIRLVNCINKISNYTGPSVFLTTTTTSGATVAADQNAFAQMDYNIHHADAGTINWADIDGTSLTLAQWQALATGHDANSLASDPLLVDALNADDALVDLHIQAGSPAIGAGLDFVANGVWPDIDDELRISPWDIGSDQRGAILTEFVEVTDETLEISETVIGVLSSAVAYVEVFDESLEISETISTEVATAITDATDETLEISETISTQVATAIVAVVNETLEISETDSVAFALVIFERSVNESLEISESVSTRLEANRMLDETLELRETVIANLGSPVVSETLELREAIATLLTNALNSLQAKMARDADVFFNPQEFAEIITYTTAAGQTRSINALIERSGTTGAAETNHATVNRMIIHIPTKPSIGMTLVKANEWLTLPVHIGEQPRLMRISKILDSTELSWTVEIET